MNARNQNGWLAGRRRTLLIFTAVLLVLGSWITARQDRGPRYRERPLSYWFDRYCERNGGINNETYTALEAIGTNAVRYLARQLRRRDSRFKGIVLAAWPKLPAVITSRLPAPRSASEIHQSAMSVLEYVARGQYETALPSLVALAKIDDPGTRICAISLIGELGPRAANQAPLLTGLLAEFVAAPAGDPYRHALCHAAIHGLGQIGTAPPEAHRLLGRLAADADPHLRIIASTALWRLAAPPAEVLPRITAELTNSSYRIREFARARLAEMGLDARPALPLIREALDDPRPAIRMRASNAIHRISAGGPGN